MCGTVLRRAHFTCGYSYPHREVFLEVKPVAVKSVSFLRLAVFDNKKTAGSVKIFRNGGTDTCGT